MRHIMIGVAAMAYAFFDPLKSRNRLSGSRLLDSAIEGIILAGISYGISQIGGENEEGSINAKGSSAENKWK